MNHLNKNRICENIDRIAAYDISNHKIFGSAYYVYNEGFEIEQCYGMLSLNSEDSVTNTTIFRLASMTKPITAVATLMLVERGVLSLDDSIDRFLPEFKHIKIRDCYGNSFYPEKLPTVRNILTHTSGIGSIKEKLAYRTESDKQTLDSAVSFFLNNGLDFEPESMQMYSGSAAFDVLTKIIETVTETDYLSFLKREIFDPCEMLDTTFVPTTEQQLRMAAMHQKVDGKSDVYEMPHGCIFEDFPCTHYLGGAGLVSTLRDYGNFAKMLLYKGKTEAGQILREETFDLLCTPQVSSDIMPGKERWGLGVRVITEDSYPYLPKGSFGWSGAYGSHFWIDPVNRVAAVFMKNSKFDGGAANESARNFEKAVYSSFEDSVKL